ncbi:MAG TPA: NAD(P)/FAD-dependent oxidoreductase [Polyangiaceae bacterium]|jgi:phytoene dehydrogenase-like protein|nr:NAD(P)/FAD-dependent oxidoreductase [Polyangiaceae bacterium]
MTADARAFDVVVVGGGHNGLVAAAMLGRSGLRVKVVEARAALGGAVRTEAPFGRAPGLRTSTGAYLLGLMPPELIDDLGLSLSLLRRDPHYFVPSTGKSHLLLGSDREQTRRQLLSFFSEADLRARDALDHELSQLRDDIAPTWLREPESIEGTAERYVRPELRQAFVDLCRKPIRDYLARFGFESELLQAMYAVTDGFSGLSATWDMPGTGMNFLVHNMCRLPGSDGTWMIVKGGMGAVTAELARVAHMHGVELETSAPVERILVRDGSVEGVLLEDGRELGARAVVVGADPFQMRKLVGRDALPGGYNARLDGYVRPGMTMKVNLALSALPKFTCLPEPIGQHRTTIHLLPEEDVLGELVRAFRQAQAGQLPERPTIEWYIHTAVDPSLQDAEGRHSSALFVQWVPNEIAGSTWEAEEERYVTHLLSICDRFAPGTSDLVVDRFTLHPKAIEQYFGMSYGHIHHVDNSFGFDDRLPVAVPLGGLFSASAACHPAGSVIGAAGYIAARRVLRELAVPAAVKG